MQIGSVTVEPWSLKNTFWRILVLAVIGAWVVWGLTIYQEGQEIQARIKAAYAENARQVEIQRHQSSYQRALDEQRSVNTGTGNIMDMLPEEEGE
jgi:hypothetical protein